MAPLIEYRHAIAGCSRPTRSLSDIPNSLLLVVGLHALGLAHQL